MPIEPLGTAQKPEQDSNELLLSTLSIVVKANVEYAKGVTDLITSDVQKRMCLEQLKESVSEISTELDDLIQSQQELTEKVDTALRSHEALVHRFKPLYVSMGLKEDGSDYSPTDKLVVKFKQVFFHKVSMVLAGALVTLLIKFLFTNGITK